MMKNYPNAPPGRTTTSSVKSASQLAEPENKASSDQPDVAQVFRRAALIGDQRTLCGLMKLGVDVNAADHHGRTALIEAAFGSQPHILEILISSGADPNAADNDGWTALMEAASKGCLECVRILLDARANVFLRTRQGLTALDMAAKGHLNIIRSLRRAADADYV